MVQKLTNSTEDENVTASAATQSPPAESRSAEERFTSPQLETVTQVRIDLITHLATRRSSRARRKSSRVARDEAFSKLVDILRLAAGQLMVQHFGSGYILTDERHARMY